MAEYRYNYFEAVGGKLTGRIGVEPFDPNDPGTTAHIIRIGNPLDLKVVWELAGEFAPYVGGDWELMLTCRNTDGVGKTEGELDKVSVPLDSVSAKSTPRRYTHTFRVPPGRVEPGTC